LYFGSNYLEGKREALVVISLLAATFIVGTFAIPAAADDRTSEGGNSYLRSQARPSRGHLRRTRNSRYHSVAIEG